MPSTAWRPAARVSAAACGALLLVPVSSIFTSPIVPGPLRLLVALCWLLAVAAPPIGLASLAVVAPFGTALTGLFAAAPIQYTETLVLATLSGALIAIAWKPRRDERSATPSMALPLAVFSAIVVSSLAVVIAVDLIGLQSQRLFFASLGTFLARDYLVSGPEPWSSIGVACQLLEGVLLVALVVCWSDRRGVGPARIIQAAAASAAIAATGNIIALLPTLRAADSLRAVATRLLTSRISVTITDVNAAGSYFAMAGFVAFALSETGRPAALRRLWTVATVVLLVALWLTGSRTAVVCVAVLTGMVIAATRSTWRERPLWPIAAGVILLAVAAALVVGFDPRAVAGRSLERTFESRAAFLITGLRMIASAPAFGVGIGRYLEVSGRFMPASIYWFFFRENAHNNFLQVGGELGLVGLAAFIWLIAAATMRVARGLAADRGDRVLRGAAGGLAAFIATWLTGHPLLTPEVAVPFWMLAGAAIARADAARSQRSASLSGDRNQVQRSASLSGERNRSAERLALHELMSRHRPAILVAVAIALLFASVPVRARRQTAQLNLLEHSVGFYEWESRPGRTRTRWASPSAAFFVPAETSEVMIPVRTMFAERHRRPTDVRFAIDGRVFDHVELTDDRWHDLRLRLPPALYPAQPRRIDIVTQPSWSLAEIFGTRNARALGVQLSEVVVR